MPRADRRLLEGGFYENFFDGRQPVAPELDDPRDPPTIRARRSSCAALRPGGSSDLKRLYLLLDCRRAPTLDITTPYFVTDESTTGRSTTP